jgi:hypothetical protein
MVLPWHFRDAMMRRYAHLLERGIGLVFPLPTIDFVAPR